MSDRRAFRAAPQPGKSTAPRSAESKGYVNELQTLVAQARTSFPHFILLMRPPGASGYQFGKLHRYLANTVQRMVDGKASKRTTISVPPQHGKSTLLTVLAAAWLAGRYPGISIALTGALAALLNDFSKQIRSLVMSTRYQWVFKDVLPVFGSNRADSWTLTNASSIVARPAGSKLTGRRVDFLIIDDPHKGREDAESQLERQRVREWYFADCYSRLAPDAKVLIVATRWHPEDLIGSLTTDEYKAELERQGQETEIFNRIVIEALCEHPENDPLGRGFGEPLCPELKRDVRFLNSVRATMPGYEWQSQYQGDPHPRQGGAADVNKLRYCKWADVPEEVEWTRGWDLALTEKQASDYTAGALVGLNRATKDLYIGHMFRDKKAWPRLKPLIADLARADAEKHEAGRIGVEVVGGFLIGKHELAKELNGEVKVVPIVSSKSKMVRAQPWFNRLDAGQVYLIEGPWHKAFKDELSAFPSGAHEDQIDAVSVGWHLLNRPALLVA